MDEREVHELLRGAAEDVQPSPDLPDRAARRYRRRRARGRALAAAVVVVVVGAGLTVAATVGGGRSATDAGPRGASTTTTPAPSDGTGVDVGEIGALTTLDGDDGYGIEWAPGGDRYLVHTIDGARTWQRRGLLPEGVTSLQFATEYAKSLTSLVAWGGGPLWQSSNGGADWHPTLGPSVSTVSAASDRLWAMVACDLDSPVTCMPRLTTSTDAGRTWTDSETPRPLGRGAQSLANPSGNTVYFVDGEFAWTPNGGRAWVRHPEPEACATRPAQRLAISVTTLLLVCSAPQPDDGPSAFVSIDQGRTWQPTAPLPSRYSNYAPIVTATDDGFLVAIGNGPLLATTDNGQSWHDAFPMPANSTVVAMSRTFGVGYWALAADQGIWFSTDGRQWEPRASASPNPGPGGGCFKVSKTQTKPGFVQCDTPAPGDIPPRSRGLTNAYTSTGRLPLKPKPES